MVGIQRTRVDVVLGDVRGRLAPESQLVPVARVVADARAHVQVLVPRLRDHRQRRDARGRVRARAPVAAHRPGRALVEHRVRQRDAVVARDEERAQETLAVRQVGGVAHHLVGVEFLDLAEAELAHAVDLGGDHHIGGGPLGIGGLVEALVLVAHHVVPLAQELEVAAGHEAQRTDLVLVLLLAHLRDAVRVLVEDGVVGGQESEAELHRESVLLVDDLGGGQRLVGEIRQHVGIGLQGLRRGLRFRRQVGFDRLGGNDRRERHRDERREQAPGAGPEIRAVRRHGFDASGDPHVRGSTSKIRMNSRATSRDPSRSTGSPRRCGCRSCRRDSPRGTGPRPSRGAAAAPLRRARGRTR